MGRETVARMFKSEHPRCADCSWPDGSALKGENPDCARNRSERESYGLSADACGLILASYAVDIELEATYTGNSITQKPKHTLRRIDVMPLEGIWNVYEAARPADGGDLVLDIEHKLTEPTNPRATLFDPEPFTDGSDQDPSAAHNRIADSLNLEIGEHSPDYPLVEVTVAPEAKVMQAGKSFSIQTDSDAYDDEMGWSFVGNNESVIPGFLRGVYKGQHGYFVHIECHVTDIGTSRIGVLVDDVVGIRKHSEEFRSVYAAYQNAEVDGDSLVYQAAKDLPMSDSLLYEELAPYIDARWPVAELVYSCDGPYPEANVLDLNQQR